MAKTIWIECSQVVHYNQQVTVTDEEYETIKSLDLDDISEKSDKEAFRIIETIINRSDVCDAEQEFLAVLVKDEDS